MGKEQRQAEGPGASICVCGRKLVRRMSGDESALQHPEHGRSEFGDAVDNTAGIGQKGQNGCVYDAYSVDFMTPPLKTGPLKS